MHSLGLKLFVISRHMDLVALDGNADVARVDVLSKSTLGPLDCNDLIVVLDGYAGGYGNV